MDRSAIEGDFITILHLGSPAPLRLSLLMSKPKWPPFLAPSIRDSSSDSILKYQADTGQRLSRSGNTSFPTIISNWRGNFPEMSAWGRCGL